MQSRPTYDLQIGATQGECERAAKTELNILKDVLRMLPAGVTIQDEHGDFVLVNEAAAAQLRIGGGRPGCATFAGIEPSPRNWS